jgi:hypothetical protein
MPNEFTVVGEHNDDDAHLLVVGADGRYYDYFAAQEQFEPIKPDGQWTVFAGAEVLDEIAPAKEGAQP